MLWRLSEHRSSGFPNPSVFLRGFLIKSDVVLQLLDGAVGIAVVLI